MGESLQNDLIREIERLPVEAQGRVLEFVRSMRKETQRGTLGTDIAQLAGTLPKEDADEMCAIIDEGRQIDHERW